MQIKMTLSFHLKPIGMAILENGNNKLWWWGYVEKEPLYTVGGNVNCTATIEVSMEAPQKTKTATAIWSNDTTLGHISKGL
jgi:hypothetical protein